MDISLTKIKYEIRQDQNSRKQTFSFVYLYWKQNILCLDWKIEQFLTKISCFNIHSVESANCLESKSA